MKRIAMKLFAGFLCMAAAAVGLLWLMQAGVMKDSYIRERVKAVDAAVGQAAEASPAGYGALEERLNIRFLLLDENNNVGYISQGMPMRGMLPRLFQGDGAPAADGQAHELSMSAGGGRYAVLGRSLQDGGKLFAVFSLADVEEASRILLNQLWIVTAVLLAASVVLALALSRAFARPIRTITNTARALAAGKLDTKADVKSKDEIGELAAALNELGGDLQKTEELRRELIANVSHELRAPLAVIQGYAETVRDVTWPQEEKRNAQLTSISDEAARLSRIISDILDYSRLQAGVDEVYPQAFSLKGALEGIVGRHANAAVIMGAGVTLECPEVTARFDPAKFERVMDNLISNAVNHADAGTAVSVSADVTGSVCRIFVQNAGEPIAPEDLPHIWERYYRAQGEAHGRRHGTGLGLAIVKSILERHGAPYGVSSQNRSTVFWFDVPIV